MAISAVVAVGESADPLVAKLKSKASKLKIGAGARRRQGNGHGPARHARASRQGRGLCRQGCGGRRETRARRVAHKSAGPRRLLPGRRLFDNVTPDNEDLPGRNLRAGADRAASEDARGSDQLINANQYANGTAVFTRSGGAARAIRARNRSRHGRRQRADPRADRVFFFRRLAQFALRRSHVHGMEGVRFYTRGKVVTTRWPMRTRCQGLTCPRSADASKRVPLAFRIQLSARENILALIRAAQGRSGAPDAPERAAVAAHLANASRRPAPGFYIRSAVAAFSATARRS